MLERRRSSITSLLGLLVALSNAMPMSPEGSPSCSDETAYAILQSHAADAEPFCKSFAPTAVPSVTQATTVTATEGELTTTVTVVATPTMVFHIDGSVRVTATIVTHCEQPTFASSSSAPEVKAAATATTSPTPAAKAPVNALPVSQGRVASNPGKVIHGREEGTPAYLAGYSEQRIAAGCGCFMSDKAVVEVQTVTMTSTVVPTHTKYWTTMAENGYVQLIHDGQPQTMTVTQCT